MSTQIPKDSSLGVYDRRFFERITEGDSIVEAAVLTAHDYLDGKPQEKGKQRLTSQNRNTIFWNSRFVTSLPREAWLQTPMVLSLARYMSQEAVSNTAVLNVVAHAAPESIIRAVRYSGLVLRPLSIRRRELDDLAIAHGGDLLELTCILDIFDSAHRTRLDALNAARSKLLCLSPFELLGYASLYAFDRLVPRALGMPLSNRDGPADTSAKWDAINDLLAWKLSESSESALRLTEVMIGHSVAEHISPFLFASVEGARPRFDLLTALHEAMAAQVELNAFLAQSADAFCFDDSIQFVRNGADLSIVEIDAELRSVWQRDGERLNRMQSYWFYRGMLEFGRSEYAGALIGRPENHEANRIAVMRAMGSRLRLVEVYGVDDVLITESGDRADLFTCLLALELMAAFFTLHFLVPYSEHLKQSGCSLKALGMLALQGLAEGMENRFPLTWSERGAKINKIQGWTVTPWTPTSSAQTAGAVLDFWSSDWIALAERLRTGRAGLLPNLFERPVLKLGKYLVQLPWMLATQNNHVAAINNLRRIGARRKEALQETRRVELQLAKLLESRGFRVIPNWMPPMNGARSAGEIDVICARDGVVLVLEVKSSYFRRTTRDAWLHGATSLRSAGVQLRRKVALAKELLSANTDLAGQLGFTASELPPTILGWIVDTSIEQGHRRFSGFLKVSFEEVMIALRDDRALLNDPMGLFDGSWSMSPGDGQSELDARWTLYPHGFSAQRFVEVVDNMLVWDVSSATTQSAG